MSGAWLLVVVALLTASACVERVRVSRGTRIPPEHRGASSAEVTETFTRHLRGERFSIAATLIDFSYVRAVTRERGRTEEIERDAYERYIRRQTSFYVHLVLHGRESCRPGRRVARGGDRGDEQDEDGEDEAPGDALDLESWSFLLVSSSGREREPSSIEPGPTQLAPSGGCLVQGYVHFDGNIGRRDEWVQLEASFPGDRHLRADLRWNVELFDPPRRRRGPSKTRARRPSRPEPGGDAERSGDPDGP